MTAGWLLVTGLLGCIAPKQNDGSLPPLRSDPSDAGAENAPARGDDVRALQDLAPGGTVSVDGAGVPVTPPPDSGRDVLAPLADAGGGEASNNSPPVGIAGRWQAVTSSNAIPSGAFPAGVEGSNSLLACRGLYRGVMRGGKAFANGQCNLVANGSEVEVQPPFDVLMGGRYGWQSFATPISTIPAGAVISNSASTGAAQYVCRVTLNGSLHPGILSDGQCHFGYGGAEMGMTQFDLLVDKPGPTVAPGPNGELVWPNAESAANSDVWLAFHHNQITEMRPQALIIDYANGRAIGDVMDRWNVMSDGFSEGSRYHGYRDPSAKPFIKHVLRKLVDLTDKAVPPGWTAPNSTKMPRLNGGIDFGQLYTQQVADQIGIADPQKAGHNLTLCELVDRGFINELFIAFNKSGSDGNVPEVIEYKQRYDSNDNIILGQFEPNAGNGSFDPADLPAARACGRSLRVDFIEMTGNNSGAMHSFSHNLEHIGTAMPNYGKFYYPLLNFDFDLRFHTPFRDWYGIDPRGPNGYITYTGQNAVHWVCLAGTSCAGQSGVMDPFDQGCGNTHQAPNSRQGYDMSNPQIVLTRCEHYGLHDGPDGKDLQTPFSNATFAGLAAKYGSDSNGGGWQVYLFQSFPGFGNKATTADGTPIKNVWPYLYY